MKDINVTQNETLDEDQSDDESETLSDEENEKLNKFYDDLVAIDKNFHYEQFGDLSDYNTANGMKNKISMDRANALIEMVDKHFDSNYVSINDEKLIKSATSHYKSHNLIL